MVWRGLAFGGLDFKDLRASQVRTFWLEVDEALQVQGT